MRHFSSKMLNDIHDNDNHDHICTKKLKMGCILTSSIFLKKSSKIFVDRNENVVPLQTYSGGENRAQRPMHKFSSADENFSQLSIINYQLTT